MSEQRKRTVATGTLLGLLALLPAARADYELAPGRTVQLPLRLENHGLVPLRGISALVVADVPWLKAAFGEGGARITFADIKEQGAVAGALRLALTKQARPGDEGRITFRFFRAEEAGGDIVDDPGALPTGAWQVSYRIKAVNPEFVRPAADLEFHFVEARRGSRNNVVTIKIRNADRFKPLENITITRMVDRSKVCKSQKAKVDKAEGDSTAVKGIEGLQILKPGTAHEFKVLFAVSKRAPLGATGAIQLRVRTATLGAKPNPWEPVVFVSVAPPDIGVPGNFEAHLYYNLPPLKKGDGQGGMDPTRWHPLPQGTRISVSEVYTLPGPGGRGKLVEQFVGYGNVIDRRGFFRCRIAPVNKRNPTLRIVAETMANRMELHWAGGEEQVLERFKVHRARAAVTPFGKRLFRNISRRFKAALEKEATLITGAGKDAKAVRFYRVTPGQEGRFVVGEGLATKKVLIPYYGYAADLKPGARKGMHITWEGELSTGGHINHFNYIADGSGALGSLGQGAMNTLSHYTGANDAYMDELEKHSSLPGLIYHNHNELHHLLGFLIRAQELVGALDYFAPGEDRTPPPLPGVIAMWRKGLHLAPGETGYWYRKDKTWRLMVQNDPGDSDARDVGLVLRGYGAALRRRFFKACREAEPEVGAGTYTLRGRIDPLAAWHQGFDLFFAARVQGDGRVLNRVTASPEARRRRSVDLDRTLLLARGSGAEAAAHRGADNPVAVAAGLWKAASRLQPEVDLLDRILQAEGGSLAWFLNLVARFRPDLLQDMVALGLCPRVSQFPHAAAQRMRINPASLVAVWDAEGVYGSAVLKPFIEYGAGDAAVGKPIRLAMGDGEATRALFPFGLMRDRAEGKRMLGTAWRDGQVYFWRVATVLPDGETFYWPFQQFTAKLGGVAPAGREQGRRFGPNRGGQVQVPAGGLDGPLALSGYRIHSVLEGRKVLGGAVYRLGTAGQRFLKPVALTLRWLPDQDPGEAGAAIYRYDPEAGRWRFQGDEQLGERRVRAQVRRGGSFALMVDVGPPACADLVDGPDPYMPGYTREGAPWTLRFTLSEPSKVTAALYAKQRRVRTLADGALQPAGAVRFTWDGKDEAGQPVPDGTYRWTVAATDRTGGKGPEHAGTVRVFRGIIGSVTGTVVLAGSKVSETTGAERAKPRARVRLAAGTLQAEADAAGAFELLGVVPGAQALVVEAPGWFPERVAYTLAEEGGDVALPPITLSDRALEGWQAAPVPFTPDGDGKDEYATCRARVTRACDLAVRVVDRRGRVVAEPLPRAPRRPGSLVTAWSGLDRRGRKLPSGWYTVEVDAWSGGWRIPQERTRLLLDRGLVVRADAFPYIFSPNDDGFDDTLTLDFLMDGDGVVDVEILDAGGAPLRTLARGLALTAGWRSLTWDGRDGEGAHLDDGLYRYRIRPAYPGGFASRPVEGAFRLDRQAPELADMEPANGALLGTGTPTIRVRLTGSLTDLNPAEVKFKIDENTVRADTIDRETGWVTFTPKTSLGAGVHIAIAYAGDLAGNLAHPRAVSFRVRFGAEGKRVRERVAPEIMGVTPAKNGKLYAAHPLLTATVRDAGSGIDDRSITLWIDGEKVTNEVRYFIPGTSGKAWDWYSYARALVLYDPLQGTVRYVPIEPLAAGRHSFAVQVRDRDGNPSAKAETLFDVILDAEAPTVEILEPRHLATLADPHLRIRARIADRGAAGVDRRTLRLLVNGEPLVLPPERIAWGEKEGLLTLTLPEPLRRDAQHGLLLTVRDRAGNLGRSATPVFNLVSDRQPPRIDRLCDPPAPGAPLVLVAAVYDLGRAGLDPAGVGVTLDGRPIPPDRMETTAVEGWLLDGGLLRLTLKDLPPGPHVLTVTARDRAGNRAVPLTWKVEVTR